jgi:hypothetical protein
LVRSLALIELLGMGRARAAWTDVVGVGVVRRPILTKIAMFCHMSRVWPTYVWTPSAGACLCLRSESRDTRYNRQPEVEDGGVGHLRYILNGVSVSRMCAEYKPSGYSYCTRSTFACTFVRSCLSRYRTLTLLSRLVSGDFIQTERGMSASLEVGQHGRAGSRHNSVKSAPAFAFMFRRLAPLGPLCPVCLAVTISRAHLILSPQSPDAGPPCTPPPSTKISPWTGRQSELPLKLAARALRPGGPHAAAAALAACGRMWEHRRTHAL